MIFAKHKPFTAETYNVECLSTGDSGDFRKIRQVTSSAFYHQPYFHPIGLKIRLNILWNYRILPWINWNTRQRNIACPDEGLQGPKHVGNVLIDWPCYYKGLLTTSLLWVSQVCFSLKMNGDPCTEEHQWHYLKQTIQIALLHAAFEWTLLHSILDFSFWFCFGNTIIRCPSPPHVLHWYTSLICIMSKYCNTYNTHITTNCIAMQYKNTTLSQP